MRLRRNLHCATHWRQLTLLLAAMVLACDEQPEEEVSGTYDPDSVRTLLTADELPPRPPYPDPVSGKLVTVTAGDRDILGEWDTDAGLCEDIGMIEVYAGETGLAVGMVIHLPEGDSIGEYRVVPAAEDFPSAPAALIAVQVFEDPEPFGFQAYVGSLEILELGERLSGRFETTLREINIDMLTHFVGVFEDIRLEPLGTEYCQTLRDSTLVSDSTSTGS